MIALSDSNVGVTAIANFLQYSVCTVRRWILQSKTGGELHDHPRSGRPAIYSEENKLRIVAFYCQTQPLRNCGRWTLQWAVRRLKAEPELVGSTPSKSTLHRILQSNHLKPHRSHYFLHITDPNFFPKMEHLIELYRNPPKYLFFFDECPGIQILKRITPDMQTDGMKKRLEEFEYIRNGTMDVLAFLNHANGKVYIECRADHKTDTFVAAFRRHVNQFSPTEPLHYVMDNLSSHYNYSFCQLVAELSGIKCPPKEKLNKQAERVEWLCRDDKRIVIHFTPYHGSWLNLVEVWFSIMGRKVLGESFGSPDELMEALEAFMDDWNTLLAHPLWTYDGNGLHEKAVKRINKMLSMPTLQMDLRILTKQLSLLTNLLRDYFSKVSIEIWEQLSILILSQYQTIANIIDKEEGPLRKKKAQNAFLNLTAAMQKYLSSFDVGAT